MKYILILCVHFLLLELISGFFLDSLLDWKSPKSTSWSRPNHVSKRPKWFKETPNLINSHGYPVEVHEAVTDDGYIIELHRIPYGRYGRPNGSQPVAFMAHSLFSTGSVYVVNGPKNALAYALADSGYDVWLLNGRGTMYSMKHKKLSPKSMKFWRFSWHEHGVYDVPASIDYILRNTGAHQVDYIGFSMGTTMYYVMASTRPQYLSKIRRYVAIAPAVYRVMLGTFTSPYIAPHIKKIDRILHRLGIREFLPSSIDTNKLYTTLCDPKNILFYPSCNTLTTLYSGPIDSSLDRKKLPLFYSQFPDTTSFGTIAHFLQVVNSEVFQRYDFGTFQNIKKYGYHIPPPYDLSKATTPTAIFYSSADRVTVPSGVMRLAKEIPNLQLLYRVPKKDFAHMTFAWAENARSLYQNRILQFLWEPLPYERYSNQSYYFNNVIPHRS